MSLKKVTQVKADRGFKIFDLIVYGIVILAVAVAFIVLFTTRDDSPLSGIRVYAKGEAVFEYSFKENAYKIVGDGAKITVDKDEEKLTVRIATDVGYNTMEIFKSGKVKVVDADCKNKDCVYSMEIKDNSGIIYCSPHGLRIVPYDYSDFGPDVEI